MTGLGEILQENSRLRDLVQLREAQLHDQEARLAAQAQELALQAEQLAALTASNEVFARRFEFLEKRRQMAAAERLESAERQAPLFEGIEVKAPPRDPALEKKPSPKGGTGPKDRRHTADHPRKGRRDVAAMDFPRRIVEAPVGASSCERCGGDRELIEPRVTHRVGWEPGHYTVTEHRQERCQCPTCPKADVWAAPEPALLTGAMCDDSLLARVLVDKFGDHIPLNRQADRMTREGFPISENVLSGWVRQGAPQVRLLVKALRQQVAEKKTILGDDTGHPVQDGTDGKLAKGRLWVFTDRQQAFFAFSRDKGGEHPTKVLQDLGVSGARLVVDGGSEYNEVVATLGLDRGGCWSHLRRYFFNAAVQHAEAAPGLHTLRDLFVIEREVAEATDAERLSVRQQRCAPLVEGFYVWVKALVPKVRPESLLGKAVGYAISQEPRMRLFLQHGDVPVTNNLSELMLRQPVVGRKNWLFSGSEGGACAAADWFSLIASCRLQRTDPWVYLYDVFGRLLDYPASRVHELTPLNWRMAVERGDIIPRSLGAGAGANLRR